MQSKAGTWLVCALVVVSLLAASVDASAQPPPTCVGLDAVTPTQHLEHALRDSNYGLCFTRLAEEQVAACDTLPTPGANDPAAGARKRICQQLAIVFQDLSVFFRWDHPYRQQLDDCKRSGASLSCDAVAKMQKEMRCLLTGAEGKDTTECLGPVPQPPFTPPKK